MEAVVKITKPAIEHNLTWTEIQKQEGIYVPQGNPDRRLVVIKHSEAGTHVIYVCDDKIQPALALCWSDRKYLRTNEKITLTFK